MIGEKIVAVGKPEGLFDYNTGSWEMVNKLKT